MLRSPHSGLSSAASAASTLRLSAVASSVFSTKCKSCAAQELHRAFGQDTGRKVVASDHIQSSATSWSRASSAATAWSTACRPRSRGSPITARPYTAEQTRAFAREIGLLPRTTPVESPQSSGTAASQVAATSKSSFQILMRSRFGADLQALCGRAALCSPAGAFSREEKGHKRRALTLKLKPQTVGGCRSLN